MAAKDHSRSPTKFYQEDIVRRVDDPTSYGVVLRCWHDAEDVPPANAQTDPMMRPLQQGEVGVSFFPSGNRDILPESDFELVDRSFQAGDICKRSIDDVRSGVVTAVNVLGRLEHVISGAPVPGWKSMNDLEVPADADIGDYVVHDDWIGQVVELYDEAVVEISGGQLVRLPELSSRLSVGEKGNDILPQPMGVQNLFGFLIGNNRPSNSDTVVSVQHTILAICWLALNQSLDPEEASRRKRPERLWYGEDLSRLTVVRGKSDQDMRVGDKVLLKDNTGLPYTTHGVTGDPVDLVVVQTFVVKETRTAVHVLWQDGKKEWLQSTELIPYLNPDEYDCWPGDHVIWKSEGEQRAAVVHSVDAVERTACIRYSDSGTIDLVSVLELDPHGTNDWSAALAPTVSDGLGVRRGDFVFIHREGTTNGLATPMVPRIGEIEDWVRDSPVQADGQLGGWRRQMSDIGATIATRRGTEHVIPEGRVQRVTKFDGSLQWFGEVTGLLLDGTAEVTHPDSTVKTYPIERLTRLYDSMEQLEDDMWGDEMSEGQGDNNEEVWSMEEDGIWRPQADGEDGEEWEETDDDDEVEDITMDVDEVDWPDSSPSSGPTSDKYSSPNVQADTPRAPDSVHIMTPLPSPPPSVVSPSIATEPSLESDVHESDDADDKYPWKRFDILASAPPDHAFFSSTPAQPSKSFLGRLSKEYRVLANSLPESIIVRAYEDRTDLLRSLIIGPENTPYQDAPFVIDWMLDSNFPNSPPIAHFLSWTNGNGRVNPNLYEEGKVCLSILGTWAGDKNEIWSAARSSLLQAFVSIQGLVLVKEPWFCEPAYEKLRGTEDGIVNSRLYSEKAYVLSRGFVRRALEIPLGSLEAEIDWFYYTDNRLEKVVREARVLIEKSKASPDCSPADRELAVPRLTAGGIITLGRTLIKLEALLEARRRAAPPT